MGKVIAAVRTAEEFAAAAESEVGIIFQLAPNIETLKSQVEFAHGKGKKLFIHIDLAEGIGKDEYGIKFAGKLGVDGIISTRTGMIKLAKNAGLFTVQRFFIVDSHSVETTVESVKSSKADMIEIMPGVVTKVISSVSSCSDVPVIAGGLIDDLSEIEIALQNGASAVSLSNPDFWKKL